MGTKTTIEWCDHTFNPWSGCTKVAPGCANCYAASTANRFKARVGQWGPGGTRIAASEQQWHAPLRWNKAAQKAGVRRRVFCASMADVFEDFSGTVITPGDGQYWDGHPYTLDDLRGKLFALIDATPWLDWLLLTKRPQNVRKMWCERKDVEYIAEAGRMNDHSLSYRDNLWLGTSVSTQADVGANLPALVDCRDLCRRLFVSAEPLLSGVSFNALLRKSLIDWVIVGGESGPGARPCDVGWVRQLVERCRVHHVPCFVKQLGSYIIDRNDAGFDADWNDGHGWPEPVEVRENLGGFRDGYQGAPVRVITRHKKGGDPAEWPADLRVGQFPGDVQS